MKSCLLLGSVSLWLALGQDADGTQGDPAVEGVCHGRFDSRAGPNGRSNMGRCEGDCDRDEDCAAGLKCKQRDAGEEVPGCSGGYSFSDWDYCYDPECENGASPPGMPTLDSSYGRNGAENMPLCAGDCDEDADCAEGLQCFQRDGLQAVPGCSGRGVPNFDYCYNSTVRPTPRPGPTTTRQVPPPRPGPILLCLCVFDIDRTLTGKQGTAGNRCPGDKEIYGIRDTAYGGGWLTLSQAGQSLQETFCDNCYLGVVSHGDAGGDGSKERDYLLQHVLVSQPFSQLSSKGAATWSDMGRVVSPLVLGWPDREKQVAVKDIVAWYAQKNIIIPPSDVFFFGDRTDNIPPFEGTGFNAREISCDARDIMVGLCGATKDEIVQFQGVKMCGEVLPPPPPASACLCVFDIDRTLTGKQSLVGSTCPSNKIMPDIWDSAYGGGPLTLSAAAQALNRSFCNSCFLGVVSAGDASGEGSQLRRFLLSDVLRSSAFDDLVRTNRQASEWCSHRRVDCPLVLRSPNRWKHIAVEGIVDWYGQQGIAIPAHKVHFFGDRTENIGPFSRKGYNAREISCRERDYGLYRDGMVGLCGAELEEIIDTPGVAQCSAQRRLLV